jgi:transposase
MRGADIQQDSLLSTVIPEERVPRDHPLRPIREMVNAALKELDADFNVLYSDMGRDSIPPEKLLRAQLLMAFYTIRNERQLMEQIDYNLLFRSFVVFR